MRYAINASMRQFYRKRRITRCGAETYSTPPTAQTTGAIESIFWLEVHNVNMNGATTAFFEFPSQTEDVDHLVISAKVLILALWSSFFGF